MHILKIGLTYKTAPIEIREKLAFSESSLEEALNHLSKQKSILENIILSTCNRMEIYVVADQVHTGIEDVTDFLIKWFHLNIENITPFLEIDEDDQAIKHLFHVASGLNSMIIGETQILGQIRTAFFKAQELSTTGTIFNELFKRAITFAKQAHRNTAIGENAVSVSYAAVELAKKIFGKIDDKNVIVLGAGEMGELTAQNLYGAGVKDITVVNRTLARAEELAGRFKATAAKTDQLFNLMTKADILISSTASIGTVLNKEDLAPIQKVRKGNPLFLLDIAIPRDINPNIAELESIFLYDIDELEHVVEENMEARNEAANEVALMINSEIVAFKRWITSLGVVPVITALQTKASSIQKEVLSSINDKMPDLSEREKRVLNKHTRSIINQLLKEPINQAKELVTNKNADRSLDLFIDIFGIDDAVKEEVRKQIEQNKELTKSDKSKITSSSLFNKIIPH